MDLHKQVHIHIEEPELSLFPDSQCKLIETIVKEAFNDKSADRELGVIMATHSPYIVNYLNLLMRRDGSGEAEGVSVNEQQVEVFEVVEGYAVPLKSLGDRPLIDTRLLSDTISDIYKEFKKY